MKKQNYITKIGAGSVALLALMSAPKAEELNTMEIVIKDKVYAVELAENQTTDTLKKMLPLTIDMSELHGNEKYYYLDQSLPTNAKPAGKISNGDIMLFGDDCLVVFYKSFDNPYSYTKIGHISNPEDLAQTLGNGKGWGLKFLIMLILSSIGQYM